MAEKKLKVRIQHKNETEKDWAKATNFIPLKGELIVYSDPVGSKLKVGDGVTKVNDLPFIVVPQNWEEF